jgi:hypothetical protein
LPLIVSLFLLVFFFGALHPTIAQELTAGLRFEPSLAALRPHDQQAQVTLLVADREGKPISAGEVQIILEAPAPGKLFSTDFPIVEGTRLSEMKLPLRSGQASWRYVFPIRGVYRMQVLATAADGRSFTQSFEFTVDENPRKWLVLALFGLILFGIGVIAGRTFTTSPALLSLGLLVAALAAADCGASVGEVKARADGMTLEIAPATVGKLSRIRWLNNDPAAEVVSSLSLSIEQVDHRQVVFAVEKLPVRGEYSFDFQFTDGSDHRITALVEVPGEPQRRLERVVAVTAVEPPLSAQYPALAAFVGVIALGLAAGRWSKPHKQKGAG